MTGPFVPPDFEVPRGYDGDGFRLEPLRPHHNERDYQAWTSSIDHIQATPGFEGSAWPHPMTLDENRRDLERHAADFSARTGFTYSVLDGDEIIGCLYIYPSPADHTDARVTSWVTASRADMDVGVRQQVSSWLTRCWPFGNPDYATGEDEA